MKKSFKSFMTHLIDYAGLFPPAGLELDAAMETYRKHLESEHAWMLGRFIIPALKLKELSEEQLSHESPLRFSVLLQGDSLEKVEDEIKAVQSFLKEHEARARLEALETLRAPFLIMIQSKLKEAGLDRAELYVESPDAEDAQTLEDLGTGFKLRCGGLAPEAFPSIETVAQVISACKARRVPFKCTAGLHHPLRHYSEETKADHHGFFNVFGAALLDLPEDQIRACLAEEDGDAFRFEDEAFFWKGFSVSNNNIEKLRKDQVKGFGSCSFEEPIQDLKSLGLLE